MSGRALIVGEALIDIVRRGDEKPVEHVGGSPLNVAVGLGRLDREVRLATSVGADERGRRIVGYLDASGVALTDGSVSPTSTATASARIGDDNAATYEFDISWQPELPSPDPGPVLVHTGSIATVLEPGCDAVADLVEQQARTSTISFDPNIRPALIGDDQRGRERIARLVALSDVVKVSDEDLAWVAPGHDLLDIARDWLSRGPSIVAVTRGASGAVAVCRAGVVELPAKKVDVVDTVGAGDAFTVGLLDALWDLGLLGAEQRETLSEIGVADLESVLHAASSISALTVARPGADLPTRAQRDRAVTP
ncbi:carbohydrate kinase [Rhodococcus sp. HNM0563]|uniref:carbohydrate kinase family protein n=1 Tax=Rhodococcus sp. HNM0563 TaxID=2716339 RepID=UPI00146B962E|nr:carbohydrate kinase [Rhodococcus sp. HNM0563]NLU62229.1 carbohydrate kinase [Rhodococcus sp. HNM0563]